MDLYETALSLLPHAITQGSEGHGMTALAAVNHARAAFPRSFGVVDYACGGVVVTAAAMPVWAQASSIPGVENLNGNALLLVALITMLVQIVMKGYDQFLTIRDRSATGKLIALQAEKAAAELVFNAKIERQAAELVEMAARSQRAIKSRDEEIDSLREQVAELRPLTLALNATIVQQAEMLNDKARSNAEALNISTKNTAAAIKKIPNPPGAPSDLGTGPDLPTLHVDTRADFTGADPA